MMQRITTKTSASVESDQFNIDLQQMVRLSKLCREGCWNEISELVERYPRLATTPFSNENYHSTTILHQAISSKGNVLERYQLIMQVLETTPATATLTNQHGSLPIHAVLQRCTRMTAKYKEQIIMKLVRLYPKSLMVQGGQSRRTPLHVLYTDFVSPHLTQFVVENGPEACSMTDWNGWLPAHIAASRHCSPKKLKMLLNVYPEALQAKTDDGDTVLSLAMSTASSKHPNFKLLDAIRQQLANPISCQLPLRTVSTDAEDDDKPMLHGKYKLLRRSRPVTPERPAKKRRIQTAHQVDAHQSLLLLSTGQWN